MGFLEFTTIGIREAIELYERYRTLANANKAIAFSVAYDRTSLLSRGLGLEHLQELLLRLVRPILRTGASLAYAGYWKESEDNFTYELLRLINAEKEDKSLQEENSLREPNIGYLYNYSAWPNYLILEPMTEAHWINSCRIVRVTQAMADIPTDYQVDDSERMRRGSRARVNAALTLSAMRRLMMEGRSIQIPDVGVEETIPPVGARILLGGKLDGYSGFLPGLFEEALVSLRKNKPLFILGGFGGAAEVLARAVTDLDAVKKEFTIDEQLKKTPALGRLLSALEDYTPLPDFVPPEEALKELKEKLDVGEFSPATVLHTGLSDDETRKLLVTSDIGTVVKLVQKGLETALQSDIQEIAKVVTR